MIAIRTKEIQGKPFFDTFVMSLLDPVATVREAYHTLRIKERIADRGLEITQDEIEAMRAELAQECARNRVFFHVPGTVYLTEQEAEIIEDAIKRRGPNQEITLDGELIDNNINRPWFALVEGRWTSGAVDDLGGVHPEGGKWAEDMSDDEIAQVMGQREEDRVAGLTDEQRFAEFEALKTQIGIEAAQRTIIFELEGDSHDVAIQKAREWRAVQLDRIRDKFGLRSPEVPQDDP